MEKRYLAGSRALVAHRLLASSDLVSLSDYLANEERCVWIMRIAPSDSGIRTCFPDVDQSGLWPACDGRSGDVVDCRRMSIWILIGA